MKAKIGDATDRLDYRRGDALIRTIQSRIFTVDAVTATVKKLGSVNELLIASQFGIAASSLLYGVARS